MLVVTAAMAIVCPAVLGAAAATVTQSIATSALVGSAISGIMNGVVSVKAGKSFFDGFASGVEEEILSTFFESDVSPFEEWIKSAFDRVLSGFM